MWIIELKEKNYEKSILAAILLSGGFFAVTMHMNRGDLAASDLLLANIEALSENEGSGGQELPCSNGIFYDTTKDPSSVFYCGSCNYVTATSGFGSGKCSPGGR